MEKLNHNLNLLKWIVPICAVFTIVANFWTSSMGHAVKFSEMGQVINSHSNAINNLQEDLHEKKIQFPLLALKDSSTDSLAGTLRAETKRHEPNSDQ